MTRAATLTRPRRRGTMARFARSQEGSQMTAVTRTGLVAALAVACASALAGLPAPLLAARQEPGVTLANFLRVRDGMTEGQVEALFGRPRDTFIGSSHSRISVWREPGREAQVHFPYGGGAEL